eukprot:SAG11_NODE_29377_length_311_cov_1.132075_1_plen_24_part_10
MRRTEEDDDGVADDLAVAPDLVAA